MTGKMHMVEEGCKWHSVWDPHLQVSNVPSHKQGDDYDDDDLYNNL